MIPSTGTGLLIALLFLVPGSVYQFARSRLRGPAPDDASATNRILRALAVSAMLDTLYAVAVGPHLVRLVRGALAPPYFGFWFGHTREFGLWALLLLFLVPAALAGLDHLRLRVGWTPRLTYDPTPRAWDFAFREIEPTYVRVLTTDGTWLGGWYGLDSFVSSYPEPREIFIETAHLMNADGSFGGEQAGSGGLYVRCDDIRSVEFVDASADGEDTERARQDQLVAEGSSGGDEALEEHVDRSS